MHYIGIDVHKRICTAVVSDDNEKVIDQIVDFETSDQELSCITDRYAPDDCRIIIENLTTAHRVYHWFKGRGYTIEGLHTGHGCIAEISNTDYKTDLEDAFKLARICKDHFTGLKITRHESGGKRDEHGHINKRGDPLVRKYLANVVVKHPIHYPDSDLSRFYLRKKKTMPHWKAVTAGMRKLVCIIWAMLTRHQAYHFNCGSQ